MSTHQCPGIPDPDCNYTESCGRICNKCGKVHRHHLLLLPPAPAAPRVPNVGEIWSFLRGVMLRGADIQASAQMTEEFHARIDAVASERADALIKWLAAAPRNEQGGE